MKKPVVFFVATFSAVALFAVSARQATSQIQVDPSFVRLQATTPGIAQSGHSNITGTAIAGQFQGDGSLLSGLDAGAFTAGLLSPAFGGTGTDTSAAVAGSLLTTSSQGAWNTLSPGNDGQVLGLVGGFPAWVDNTGFALPYVGSANVPSPDAVVKFSNTSTTNGSTLWLEAAGTNGIGVYCVNSATTGFAYGGLFRASSPDGRAVFGENTATTGLALGGRFGTSSTSGIAVYATSAASSGSTRGVLGESYSPDGVAVYGIDYSTFGGLGLYGSGSMGVYGKSTAPVGGTGVQGEQGGFNGYGVYALGRFGASGTKAFRIDHPLDPTNKYLLHYSTESPEPMNFYSGIVVTDAQGAGWVKLPDYFAEINKDFRYTLTVVDDTDSATFVQVKVAREIRDNQFKIRTSAPHVKVSWRVEAVRNDRWVKKYGAPETMDKTGREKGKYQHPELYGEAPSAPHR